jgi:hypothetical protein
MATFNTKVKVNDEEKIYQVSFAMHVNIYVVCRLHKLIQTSYVTCTKIPKTNDKMIGINLN